MFVYSFVKCVGGSQTGGTKAKKKAEVCLRRVDDDGGEDADRH